MRKYRFWYHYNRLNKKMTLHFRGVCYLTKNIECKVPCETKWNKVQPIIIMRGYCKEIETIGDKAIIK